MASQPPREPTASQQALALAVGVMGGAGHDIPEAHLAKAEELGEAIGEQGCVLVTGACPGLPFAAARGAKRKGATVIGISPGLSLYEHAYKYESPTAYHDILIFTGSGLMGREVVNIRSSDIVAFIGGSSGTLGELAIARRFHAPTPPSLHRAWRTRRRRSSGRDTPKRTALERDRTQRSAEDFLDIGRFKRNVMVSIRS